MPHRLSRTVNATFTLAKQFGAFTYPDHKIDWNRLELLDHHDYEISPSHLGRKLLEDEDLLSELERLSKESEGPIYVEFDAHLNGKVYDKIPKKSTKGL